MSALPSWQDVVARLSMQPHPEGGYFVETYRGAASTAIYYLLPYGERSRLHRLKSDELFHFYLGGGLTLVELKADGKASTIKLGGDLAAGRKLQHAVPAGTWFGGWCDEGPYALVGCTVAPPFQFSEFELGDCDALARDFPAARELIERLR